MQAGLLERGDLARVGEQRGLALVFLNGCSTQAQVQGLLAEAYAAPIREELVARRITEIYEELAAARV